MHAGEQDVMLICYGHYGLLQGKHCNTNANW